MIEIMSKKPKRAPRPATDAAKPTPIYLRIDSKTDRAMTKFIKSQAVPPERTVVTITALHEFLAKHGCWPIEDNE